MTEEEELQLTVDIQPGMKDGDQIKFDQVADEAVGHIPGDLIFIVKQTPHPLFQRNGDNLSMSLTISLLEALVGFKKSFEHVDGHAVTVEKKDVTYCSEILVVRGEGMPRKGGGKNSRGDLLVTLLVQFPRDFNPKQKELLRQAITMA
jgi:DnaJ family protein B protein 11